MPRPATDVAVHNEELAKGVAFAQERAERVRLRQAALAEFDKAISLAGASQASRVVMINGQETEIDLKDLPDLRAQLFQQVQTDR